MVGASTTDDRLAAIASIVGHPPHRLHERHQVTGVVVDDVGHDGEVDVVVNHHVAKNCHRAEDRNLRGVEPAATREELLGDSGAVGRERSV